MIPVKVAWTVLTIGEFNGSCLVERGMFPPATPDMGVMVVGTAMIPGEPDLIIAGPCPLWRKPDSLIDEELSPELDAMLDREVGQLHEKVVFHV